MKKKTYIEYKNGKIVRNKEYSKPDTLFSDENLENTNEKTNSTGEDQRGDILNGENKNLNKGNTPKNQTPSRKQDGEDESSLKAKNINEDINTHKEESKEESKKEKKEPSDITDNTENTNILEGIKEENTEKNKEENKKPSNILNNTENTFTPEKTKKETKKDKKELEKERERKRILEEIKENKQSKIQKNTVGSPYKSIITTNNEKNKKESTNTSNELEEKKEEKKEKKKKDILYHKKNTKEWIVSLLLWILIIMSSLFVLMFVYRAGENSNIQNQEPQISLIERVRNRLGGVRDNIINNRFVTPFLGNQDTSSTNGHMKELGIEDLSSFSSHTSSLLSSTNIEDISVGDVNRVIEEMRERKREKVIDFHEFKLTRDGLIQDLEKIKSIETELLRIGNTIKLNTQITKQIETDLKKTTILINSTKSFKPSSILLKKVQ